MTKSLKVMPRLTMLAVLAALSVGSAYADKPEWAGKNKPSKESKDRAEAKQSTSKSGGQEGHGFNDDSRRYVNEYYGSQFRKGKCPPGLAKKNNGCMPPGQAKKWAKGKPIPQDVRVYDLPRELSLRLPPPPPQHRYVRVASDILLIAIGTQMVVDAIEDIGR